MGETSNSKFFPCRHAAFPPFPGERNTRRHKVNHCLAPPRNSPTGTGTSPRRVPISPAGGLGTLVLLSPSPSRPRAQSGTAPATRVPPELLCLSRALCLTLSGSFRPSAPGSSRGGRGSQVTHPPPQRDSGCGPAPGAVRGRGGPDRPPTGSRRARPAAPSRAKATARGDWSCPAAPLRPSGPGAGEEAGDREGVDAQWSRARAECSNSGSLTFSSSLMITYFFCFLAL